MASKNKYKPLGEMILLQFLGVLYVKFLYFFFCECILFSLRNPRINFRAAVLSCCGDMLKMGGNSIISFPGVFFNGFL